MVQILELFGGIGSPRCALRNLNIPTKAIDYVEIDEKAVRSYNAMFAEELEYKTQSVVGWNLKPDILIHGSPCQDMSIAGHQGKATAKEGRINRGKGADKGSGTRSSLMWETIHIIQNMGEWKPEYVIWENVKNVLNGYNRKNFEQYISEMQKLGYTSSYQVLDARDFGLPQARERVFTVSVLNGEPFDFTDLIRTPMRNISEFLLDKRYFDLDTNYQYYIDHIDPEDAYLTAAAAAGAGIRILRQEPWETLISFTISQNNNIPRIKQSIELLCSIHGKGHITEDGQMWYEFPEPEALTNIEWLQGLGLGYRDKYIQKMAENVAAGAIDLQRLADEEMSDAEIESYLKSIYGIGPKVANCIMLFGYHRIDSVPKDTWINKIIKEHYNGKFPVEMYAGFAGVIQQYIFNYAANKNLREVEE